MKSKEEDALKRTGCQSSAIWFQKHKQSIIKYSKVTFFVAVLVLIMHLVIGDQKKGLQATIFSNIEGISIFTALVIYILEDSERKQRKHYEAWQVIDAAHGIGTSYARKHALKDLYEDGG